MTTDVGTPATSGAGRRPAHPPLRNRLVLRWLSGRTASVGSLAALRYASRDGCRIELPVMAALDGDRITVLVADAATKRWWRHFPLAAVPEPAPLLRGRDLSRAWFRTVTAAEFAGFAVPATVAVLTADTPVPVAVAAVLGAGAVEGAMLGWGQATVLRRAIPAIATRRWIAATSIAAVIAYALGLTPSTFAATVRTWPPALTVGAGLVLGTALLATIGTAQWLILRHHVDHARRWVLTTALAWLAGLVVFLGFAMPLWHPGQPTALIIGIGVAGGLLMAATTAMLTGAALRRLLNRTDPHAGRNGNAADTNT